MPSSSALQRCKWQGNAPDQSWCAYTYSRWAANDSSVGNRSKFSRVSFILLRGHLSSSSFSIFYLLLFHPSLPSTPSLVSSISPLLLLHLSSSFSISSLLFLISTLLLLHLSPPSSPSLPSFSITLSTHPFSLIWSRFDLKVQQAEKLELHLSVCMTVFEYKLKRLLQLNFTPMGYLTSLSDWQVPRSSVCLCPFTFCLKFLFSPTNQSCNNFFVLPGDVAPLFAFYQDI